MSEPIHVISLGAGVQSSTMALMAAKGEIVPMPKCSVFADTQAEPESVYSWLNWLEKQLPFPNHRVTYGNLGDSMLRLRRSKKSGRIYQNISAPVFTIRPDGKRGIMQRRCTVDYKIRIIIKFLRTLVIFRVWKIRHAVALSALALWAKQSKEARKLKQPSPPRPQWAWNECQSDPLVIQWIGISIDEAYRGKEAREPWIKHIWPLIDAKISRQDCLQWMKDNGYPIPPRSACIWCPYHSDFEWQRLQRDEPMEFAKAIAFEKQLQEVALKDETRIGKPFLHSSRIPLGQVDFSQDSNPKLNLFQNECVGMCGV